MLVYKLMPLSSVSCSFLSHSTKVFVVSFFRQTLGSPSTPIRNSPATFRPVHCAIDRLFLSSSKALTVLNQGHPFELFTDGNIFINCIGESYVSELGAMQGKNHNDL